MRTSLQHTFLWMILCALLVAHDRAASRAPGQEPSQTDCQLHKSLPLQAHVLLARHLGKSVLPKPSQVTQPHVVARITELHKQYATVLESIGGEDRNDERFDVLLSRAIASPYDEAAAAIWRRSAIVQFDALVRRPLTASEREEALDLFCKVNLDDLLEGDDRNRDVARLVNASTGFLYKPRSLAEAARALPQIKKGVDAISKVIEALEKAETVVRWFKGIVGSGGSEERMKAEFKELQESMKQMRKESVSALSDIGTRLDRTEQAARAAWADAAVAKYGVLATLHAQRHYANDTAVALAGIRDGQLATHTTLQKLYAEFRTTSEEFRRDLSILKWDAFNRLPSAEKLVWLRSGKILENATQVERDALVTKLQVDLVCQDVDKYLSHASALMSILARAGLDPKIAEAASKGITLGSGLNRLVHSIVTSGDTLGAALNLVAGVVGIVFDGGPDIGELRHDEVMKGLAKLRDGQVLIVTEVVKTQEMIVQLSKQLHSYHQEVLSQFEDIKFQLKAVLALVRAASLDDYNRMRAVLFDSDKRRFRYSSESVAHLKLHSDEIEPFRKGYHALTLKLGVIDERNGVAPELLLKTALAQDADDLAAARSYKDKVWPAHVRVLEAVDKKEPGVILGLSEPRILASGGKTLAKRAHAHSNFGELLNVTAVVEYAETVERVLPLLFVMNSEITALLKTTKGGVVPTAEVFSSQMSKANEMVKKCLAIVDLAIAQQSVLEGGPLLKTIWEERNGTDAKLKADIAVLLEHNGLLRDNLAVFAVANGSSYKGARPSFLAYELACLSPDQEIAMSIVSPSEVTLSMLKWPPEGKRWHLYWSDKATCPMPSTGRFVTGALIRSREMNSLLNVRGALLRWSAGVDFKSGMESDDENLLTEVFVKSSLSAQTLGENANR